MALLLSSKEAESVREANAQYLGQTDPNSVKGALADLQERMATVERKLAFFGETGRLDV